MNYCKKLLICVSALSLFAAGCVNEHSGAGDAWQSLPPGTEIKMFAYLSEFLKISPRDSGTVNAGRSSQWLAQEIRRMGLKPQADTWTETTAYGRKTFSNIYVDFPGETNAVVLFGSHYDTKVGISDDFQGANDGGSSTAVLLGLIDHFATIKPKLHYTVRFAFFDGEECVGSSYRQDDGLHGSKRMALFFVHNQVTHPLRAAIILDMIGDKSQSIKIPRNVTPELARMALEISQKDAAMPRVSLAESQIIDDHLPFILVGGSALDLIDFEYGSAPGKHDYWHTAEDTIDKISPQSLRKAGSLALALLARLEDQARQTDAAPDAKK